MGGDTPPQVLFEAVVLAAKQLKAPHSLLVIATKSVVSELRHLDYHKTKDQAKIEYHVVADAITMGDEPLGAVRRKKGSSIVVGIRLLKKNRIDAFVSSGNTGALIASAALSLPKLPGIKRPALLAMLPTEIGSLAVVDIGGNVSCKAHHLVQFAQLGAAYQRSIMGKEKPVVGLLNIGVESGKGTAEVQQAYEILMKMNALEEKRMHFLGNIEGLNVFEGTVDVLVTDGFTGNVLLKTTEGASEFIFKEISKVLEKHSSPPLQHALRNLRKKFNYAEYPGAFLCGVDRVVIKCHGNATTKALLSGIKGAFELVEKETVARLKEELLSNDLKDDSDLNDFNDNKDIN